MKFTRIAAVSIILVAGLGGSVQAQTIRPSAQPAEFPPASYRGRQFVDSKGCVFIRAGVDGNVTWVPRVDRARKQLCGAQPTQIAGATSRPASAPAPELITLPEADQPQATASRPPVAAAVKPQRSPASTSTGAATPVIVPARPVQPVPQMAKPARRVAPPPAPVVPAPSTTGGRCPGASALSQQYINNSADVRCGPQTEDPLSSLTPNTRILPTHVYQERRLSADLTVPEGYRAAWEDGRMNPRRAERTVQQGNLSAGIMVPQGYVLAERDDNRLNPMRGVGTAAGDAQMAQVWQDGVPRRAVVPALDKTPFKLRQGQAAVASSGLAPVVTRLSTRSASDAVLPEVTQPAAQRYVRAATFADPAEAREVARALQAATGLPTLLGTVTRKGQPFKVVLSGPYTVGAEKALLRIRSAGFSGARLSK
ncbi:SPOR domain-containing protein [Phaeobacter sp. HF9A]|uniref:SPOR domain-containing protein n=1 Tax=Phaeobacter sp. HF9A TaxID=2721561 RepID=UPI001431278D|nr:SPOR domain-containing protein [Phaeobacter sp. HF9A]NIZ15466.1 SPOR domain-containing protein [Phaeobacter sp. HF9A]